jgi:hypothetical protein
MRIKGVVVFLLFLAFSLLHLHREQKALAGSDDLNGNWTCTNGCSANVTVNNGVFDMWLRKNTVDGNVGGSSYLLDANGNETRVLAAHFVGNISGQELSGTVSLPAMEDRKTGCKTNGSQQPFSGRVSEDFSSFTLKYAITQYMSTGNLSLAGPICTRIWVTGATPVSTTLVRN